MTATNKVRLANISQSKTFHLTCLMLIMAAMSEARGVRLRKYVT